MRFFLITGFGLDKRAFDPLNLPEDRFVLFDLIPALPGETLPDYALRMAGKWGWGPATWWAASPSAACWAWKSPRPSKTRGVILIASATHPRHIRKRFLIWSHIAPYAPGFRHPAGFPPHPLGAQAPEHAHARRPGPAQRHHDRLPAGPAPQPAAP